MSSRGPGEQFDPEDYVDLDAHDDVSARMRQRLRRVEEMTGRHMQVLEEHGDIRHLHGKPLDLDDDPNRLAARVLKQAGFTHPVLEQRRELHTPLAPVREKLERLRGWRERLTAPGRRLRLDELQAFNADRERLLDAYRAAIGEVNRAILDFNLTAPTALHERSLVLDREMARQEADIPALGADDLPTPQPPKRRRWGRFFTRRQD
jgi:hypothetical protein